MNRIGSTLRVSLVALASGLAPAACQGGVDVDTAEELGSSERALLLLGHQHDQRDKDRDKPCKPEKPGKGNKPGKGKPPCAEPVTEPAAFTPQTAAARSKRHAGVAVQASLLASDAAYAQFVADHFGQVTPENEMKWGPLQPDRPHRWSFGPADSIVDFAQAHELPVRGHTLIWHSQLPAFISDDLSDLRLRLYAEEHVVRTVNHFRKDVYGWDVVNEAIADDGSLRVSPFSEAFGEHYIAHAFRLAHLIDRDAKLYYNDYGIEGFGPKSDAVYGLMERLLDRRVPVDGVGFQGHFDARFMPSLDELVSNFQRFADLGLKVNVSELDVRVARIGGSKARRLAVQKQLYQRVAAACVQVEACEGITTWGFTDAHSWVDSTFGADDPLLLDESYQKKPAYFGYVDGWLGVPLDDPSLEPNLIGNSSLEAGLDGWSVMGAGQLSSETELAHTGLRSLRAGGRAASWQGPRHDVTALVSAGRTYDASLAVRLDGAASATANLTAHISCAGADAVFQQVASGAVSDAAFTVLAGELTLPDCDVQSVALYAEGPAAGVDLLVDDLGLREQPLPNLIGNPDFESGIGGWFGWGPSTLSLSSDSHSGAGAVVATGRSDSWNGVATDVTAGVAATASYRASAWMKVSGAAADSVVLTAAVGCAGAATQFVRVGAATSAGEWVEVSGTLAVPNCVVQSVVLYGEGPAAGVDLYLDDVSLSLLDAGQGPNVVANSGFESGVDGWFGFGAVAAEATSARAHGGDRSARIGGRTASWQGLATSLVGQLTPGASYALSAWAQVGDGSSPLNMTLQSACDGGAESYTFVAGTTANAATWTELQGTLVAPSCNLTTANLYIEGAPAGVDIYLDDVVLRPTP